MLDPNKNRLNFGESLRPPLNYELDFAIGTTYSLDLEAIMFLPVALFLGEDFKIEKTVSNELLSTLTKVPEKVLLFCQKGKIKPPHAYSEILAFWEQSVVQVHLDKFDRSFHPKIWLIRYKAQETKQPIKYKFICTSRNLTQSKDWDMAIVIDGEVNKGANIAQNQRLLEFIKYISLSSNNVPSNILNEIKDINFDWGVYDNLQFHPIGIGQPQPILFDSNKKVDDMLVISPFLHKSLIEKYLNKSTLLYLFSSNNELQKIDKAVLKKIKEVFQFNPILEDGFGVSESSEQNDDQMQDDSLGEYDTGQNIHAKLYVTQSHNTIN